MAFSLVSLYFQAVKYKIVSAGTANISIIPRDTDISLSCSLAINPLGFSKAIFLLCTNIQISKMRPARNSKNTGTNLPWFDLLLRLVINVPLPLLIL